MDDIDFNLMKRWVNDLRTTKVEQAYGSLRLCSFDGTPLDCFCALGRFYAIQGATWRQDPVVKSAMNVDNWKDLPGVPSWLGEEVFTMNDGGSTFAEIADYIENELDKLTTL